MNTVLRSHGGYYIVSVKREGSTFYAVSKCVHDNGVLKSVGSRYEFATLEDAEKKCRQIARMKAKKRGLSEVDMADLPEAVKKALVPDLDMQLSPQEMAELVARSKVERYVVFEDLNGLGDFFDLGVEYLGYEVDDGFVEVHDKFGDLRGCFTSRMSSVRPTERCAEAGGSDG